MLRISILFLMITASSEIFSMDNYSALKKIR